MTGIQGFGQQQQWWNPFQSLQQDMAELVVQNLYQQIFGLTDQMDPSGAGMEKNPFVNSLQHQMNPFGMPFGMPQLDPLLLVALFAHFMQQFQQAFASQMGGGGGHCCNCHGSLSNGSGYANRRSVGSDGWNQGPLAPMNLQGGDGDVPNQTAVFDSVSKAGARSQMMTGRITVNGRTYNFRSGGGGRGNLPPGEYQITPHMWSRGDRSMNVGGVGYSFAMSDKYDSRVGGTRSLLRIHPDGGGAGTIGCIGVVGNASVQAQFREDMRAELARNGGSFTLRVG